MPQLYFLDNYCYEISNTCISVYKYDILDQVYVKIDQYSTKQKLPQRYENALKDIEANRRHSLEGELNKLSIASWSS